MVDKAAPSTPETAAAAEIATFISGDNTEIAAAEKKAGKEARAAQGVTDPDDEPSPKEGDEEPVEGEEPEEDEEEPVEGEEPEEGEEEPVEDEAEPPKKKTFKERAADLTRLRRAAERRAEAAEAELATLRSGKEPTKKEEPAKEEPKVAKPKPSDFTLGEFDGGYIEALAEWKANELFAKDKAERAKEEATREQQRVVTENTSKAKAIAEAGIKAYPDKDGTGESEFEAKVLSSPIITKELTQTIHDLILTSTVGHKIAYHLATHPKEAREVFSKTPMAQAAFFGRLEERFTAKAVSKVQTRAPKVPPPQTNARGAGGKFQTSPATTDFASFEAMATAKR
jgi:hypothetical protein